MHIHNYLYAPFAQNGHLKRFANVCLFLVGAACFFARLPMIYVVAAASCYTYIFLYELFMTFAIAAAAAC